MEKGSGETCIQFWFRVARSCLTRPIRLQNGAYVMGFDLKNIVMHIERAERAAICHAFSRRSMKLPIVME